jgi:NADPH:quinone reductase-like Zn-dependent oxidoreductase
MKAIRISQYGDSSVMQLVDTPQPKPRVKHSFPLAQAAQAHRLLEGRQTTGKLIRTV